MTTSVNASPSKPANEDSLTIRYIKLAVLVVIAGNIYPLIYLRQNFEVSMLESFGLTAAQLGQNYSMLGLLYLLTYIPSGWLADRVSPRILMSFSLASCGALGVWYSTFPGFAATQIIFAGWGICAGLTFWSAMLKATALLAKSNEQGRFFGILDGGRGLVEAILATIAIGMFGYFLNTVGEDTPTALNRVIWLYVGMQLVLAPIAYFVLNDHGEDEEADGHEYNVFRDLVTILKKEEIWLCCICILTGYQLFFATYSFSAYIQNHHGLGAVAVGWVTVAKLWMRPIGAVTAGFAGDFLDREKVLGGLMILASIALYCLTILPTTAGQAALLFMVLLIGILTYAVRGVYWATLESANVSNRIKGLAIGFISLVAFSPDIYLPALEARVIAVYPGKAGSDLYFTIIAVMGASGAFAAWRLKVLVLRRAAMLSAQQAPAARPDPLSAKF